MDVKDLKITTGPKRLIYIFYESRRMGTGGLGLFSSDIIIEGSKFIVVTTTKETYKH